MLATLAHDLADLDLRSDVGLVGNVGHKLLAVLAHALPLLARSVPVSHVATATGYASDSAFTAMFKAAMGQPPSLFQRRD